MLQISPVLAEDFGLWTCHAFEPEVAGNDDNSITWSLVVLPTVEKLFLFRPFTANGDENRFLTQQSVITVQEGDSVKLYCSILVNKAKADKKLLKWSSKMSNSSLDLSNQALSQFFVQNNDEVVGLLNELTLYKVDRLANMESLQCTAQAA